MLGDSAAATSAAAAAATLVLVRNDAGVAVERAFDVPGNGAVLVLGRGTCDGIGHAMISRKQLEVHQRGDGSVVAVARGLNPCALLRAGAPPQPLVQGTEACLQMGDRIALLLTASGPCTELVLAPAREMAPSPSSATPTLESPMPCARPQSASQQDQQTVPQVDSHDLQHRYEQLLACAVNVDSARGLDVAQLVDVLRDRATEIESLQQQLSSEREQHAVTQAALARLQSSDAAALARDNDALRAELECMRAQHSETEAMLEALRDSALQAAAAAAGSNSKTPNTGNKKQRRSDVDLDDTPAPAAADKKPRPFLDPSLFGVDVDVREDDVVVLNNYDGRRHFERCWKGDVAFALGDHLYVQGDEEDAVLCRLEDIVQDPEDGGICGIFQWFYRHADLLAENIEGADPRPSEMSRTRELWLSSTRDNNSMLTVIGKFSLLDLGGAKGVKRADVEAYIDECEHNYFMRNRVDAKYSCILR